MTLSRACSRAIVLLFTLTHAHGAAGASRAESAPGVFYLSSGRFAAIVAMLVGIVGLVSGIRALRASTRAISGKNAQRRLSVALLAGPVAIVLGGSTAASAAGGVGTGNGFGGAVLGLIMGVIAVVLGAVTHRRRG